MNPRSSSTGRRARECRAAERRFHAVGAKQFRYRSGREIDRRPAVALACYAIILLWHSLVPVGAAVPQGAPTPVRQCGLPLVANSYPDTLSNILLYIPLGALLAAAVRRRLPSYTGATACAAMMACVLSYLIEQFQEGMGTRVSSFGDWVCNTIGAVIGAAALPALVLIGEILVAAWRRDLRRAPLLGATHLYALALAVVALVPWLFTIDPSTVQRNLTAASERPAWRQAFGEPQAEFGEQGSYLAAMQARRESLESLWRAAYECGAFALLALLVVVTLRDGFGFGRIGQALLCLWITFGYAIALAAAQLLVRHNDVSSYAVAARAVGCAAGVLLSQLPRVRAMPTRLLQLFVVRNHTIPLIVSAPALATIVFAHLYLSWVPFVVHVDEGGPQLYNTPTWLMLHGYAASAWLPITHDVITKLLRFVLFGFVAAGSMRAEQRGRTMRVVFIALALAAISESVQVFIPGRYPDLTELLLAGVGAAIGCGAFGRLFGTAAAESDTGGAGRDRGWTFAAQRA